MNKKRAIGVTLLLLLLISDLIIPGVLRVFLGSSLAFYMLNIDKLNKK